MLGKEKENERIKVDRYWPEEGEPPLHFHNIQVALKEKLYDAELSIAVRKLELTYTHSHSYLHSYPYEEEEDDKPAASQASRQTPTQIQTQLQPQTQTHTRLVVQYQYEGWPDHGVPSSAAPIRQLVRIIEQERLTLSFSFYLPYSLYRLLFFFFFFLFHSISLCCNISFRSSSPIQSPILPPATFSNGGALLCWGGKDWHFCNNSYPTTCSTFLSCASPPPLPFHFFSYSIYDIQRYDASTTISRTTR